MCPEGYFHIEKSGEGGSDVVSSLETQFGAKQPNERKSLGAQEAKIGAESQQIVEKMQLIPTRDYTAHLNLQIISEFQRQNLGYLSLTYILALRIQGGGRFEPTLQRFS